MNWFRSAAVVMLLGVCCRASSPVPEWLPVTPQDLERYGGYFFQLPASNSEQAVALRTARLVLALDGGIAGDVTANVD